MQTKIAIAFAVAVVLGVAFMVYRHVTKEEKKEAYVEKTFSQMTEAAQKSPKAGLSYMGMAIKKYHREHQKYPEQLALLYPEYIKDKGFIEEVDWEYQAQKDNFVLSK